MGKREGRWQGRTEERWRSANPSSNDIRTRLLRTASVPSCAHTATNVPRQGTPYICAGFTCGYATETGHRWKVRRPEIPMGKEMILLLCDSSPISLCGPAELSLEPDEAELFAVLPRLSSKVGSKGGAQFHWRPYLLRTWLRKCPRWHQPMQSSWVPVNRGAR